MVTFFCGGFIGQRAFSANFWTELLWPIAGVYSVIGFLCLTAGLDLREAAIMIGFASVGIITSTILSLILRRWFSPIS